MQKPYYTYQPNQKPDRAWPRKAIVFIMILVLVTGAAGKVFWQPVQSGAQSSRTTTTQADVAVAKMQKSIDEETMRSQINEIITKYQDLDIAVSLVDTLDGTTYDYGLSDVPFVAASTTKLLTAALLLKQVEDGNMSLSTNISGSSASYLLRQMIVNSDNIAWHSLNSYLGDDQLQAFANDIGVTSYNQSNNSLTSADMAMLLQKLYAGDVLNSDNTELLLGYMKQAGETEYIVAAAEGEAEVYHKAGYLADRVLDAAIIDNGSHPYVLVIFTKASVAYDSAEEVRLFNDITKVTLKTFSSN